jgi:hypothetical protein
MRSKRRSGPACVWVAPARSSTLLRPKGEQIDDAECGGDVERLHREVAVEQAIHVRRQRF